MVYFAGYFLVSTAVLLMLSRLDRGYRWCKVIGWLLGMGLWVFVAKICVTERFLQMAGRSSDTGTKFAENSGILFLFALGFFGLPAFGSPRKDQRLPVALVVGFILAGIATILLYLRVPFVDT